MLWFAAGLIILLGLSQYNYIGGDFSIFYYATHRMMAGQSPYLEPGYYSPVIVSILFAPLTLFSVSIAYKIYAAISILLWIVVIRRIRGTKTGKVLIALSPLVLMSVIFGNIEFLPILAMFVSPWIGIILALAKPQMGLVLAGYVLWIVWREQGMTKALWTALPAGIILLVSYVMGMRMPNMSGANWNLSLFPWSIPVAGIVTFVAFFKKNPYAALAAGVFLSNYVGPMSWIAVAPLASRNKWTAIVFFVASFGILAMWGVRIH